MEKLQQFKNKEVTLAVHSSSFHADDCLCVCLIKKLLDESCTLKVIRSRDDNIVHQCDIVADVGSIYDLQSLKFDHHQQEFKEVFPGQKIKLCASGLIFRDLGKYFVQKVLNINDEDFKNFIYNYIYIHFIQPIDGADNGLDSYNKQQYPNFCFSYDLGFTSITSRIARYNGYKTFEDACNLMERELDDLLDYIKQSLVIHYEPLKKCFEEMVKNNQNYIEYTDAPQSLINLFQKQFNTILYYTISFKDNQWRIKCANKRQSFECINPLPAEWRGLRDTQLSTVSGINGGIFVHNSGFLGVWETKNEIYQVLEHLHKIEKENQIVYH